MPIPLWIAPPRVSNRKSLESNSDNWRPDSPSIPISHAITDEHGANEIILSVLRAHSFVFRVFSMHHPDIRHFSFLLPLQEIAFTSQTCIAYVFFSRLHFFLERSYKEIIIFFFVEILRLHKKEFCNSSTRVTFFNRNYYKINNKIKNYMKFKT